MSKSKKYHINGLASLSMSFLWAMGLLAIPVLIIGLFWPEEAQVFRGFVIFQEAILLLVSGVTSITFVVINRWPDSDGENE